VRVAGSIEFIRVASAERYLSLEPAIF